MALPAAAAQVAVGNQFACARLADGSIWCWGGNVDGQLGYADQCDAYPHRPSECEHAGPRQSGPLPAPATIARDRRLMRVRPDGRRAGVVLGLWRFWATRQRRQGVEPETSADEMTTRHPALVQPITPCPNRLISVRLSSIIAQLPAQRLLDVVARAVEHVARRVVNELQHLAHVAGAALVASLPA